MGGSSSTLEYSPIVITKSGPIRGKEFRVFEDRIVDGYLGIPYAKPPVRELRFQRPVPVEPWKNTRDCIQFGPRSPQMDEFFAQYLNIVNKDEAGCLTLNVIAPRWKSEEFPKGLPVMVWIHGGGFAIHSSSNYGDSTVARNLCVKDVVYVSINYRLGVLGFFTTGDEHCPGNMGLWDQTLALKWVKENIEKFGGNPKNITIFGQSAGGASVDLLCLSPHSRDLFQKAIPMAGCAENYFAIRSKEAQKAVGLEFAKFIGWHGDDDDSEGLFNWMMAQPTSRLEIGLTGMHEKKRFIYCAAGYLAFVPNLDGDFFPEPLDELRKSMPPKKIMTGTTEWEGLFFSFVGKIPKTIEGTRKFVQNMIKERDYGKEFKLLQVYIMKYYMQDVYDKYMQGENKETLVRRYVQMVGDLTICNGVFNYARKMAELRHDVYFYSFNYCNPNGFGYLKWIMPFKAATHCTELRYILGKGIISKFKPNDDDHKMIEIMTTYFSNFAKYGNPNGKAGGEWDQHNAENPYRHFKIDLPVCEMTENYQGRRAEFWYSQIEPRKLTCMALQNSRRRTLLQTKTITRLSDLLWSHLFTSQ